MAPSHRRTTSWAKHGIPRRRLLGRCYRLGQYFAFVALVCYTVYLHFHQAPADAPLTRSRFPLRRKPSPKVVQPAALKDMQWPEPAWKNPHRAQFDSRHVKPDGQEQDSQDSQHARPPRPLHRNRFPNNPPATVIHAQQQDNVVETTVDTMPESDNIWTYTPPAVKLETTGPYYSLQAVRSIMHHSDRSWQSTRGQAKGHFVQTLIWMRIENASRPEKPEAGLNITCKFVDPQLATAKFETVAIINAFTSPPWDRHTEQSFLFFADCPVPDSLQGRASSIQSIKADVEFNVGMLTTITLPEYDSDAPMIMGKRNMLWQITPPMPVHSEFAVCVTPVTHKRGNIPLWSLLEWREHFARMGIDRVNWYGRDASFKAFVDGYQAVRGGNDIFHYAQNLNTLPGEEAPYWINYADQDLWYADCMLNNIYSSDFVLVLDTDEFFMPDFSSEYPMEGFKEYMRGLHASIGPIEFERVEMSRDPRKGKPIPDDLMQAQFECTNEGIKIGKPGDAKTRQKLVKTMYRSFSALALNQHRRRKTYPLPSDIILQAGSNNGEDYQWLLHKRDQWPKLVHYRWYGLHNNDFCEGPSPVLGEPRYQEYVKSLRESVKSLVKTLEHVNDINVGTA